MVKKLMKYLVMILAILSLIVQCIAFFADAEGRSVSISFFLCLLWSAAFLLLTRNRDTQGQYKNEGLRFILAGSMGAMIVETIFWAVEKLVGSVGVAAHPNLIVDLLVTMPFYAVMVVVFYFVNRKCGFTWREALVIGAFYELAVDGVYGRLLGGMPISFEYILQLPLMFGVFMVVYFPIFGMPLKYYNLKRKGEHPLSTFWKIVLAALPPLAAFPVFVIELIIFLAV